MYLKFHAKMVILSNIKDKMHLFCCFIKHICWFGAGFAILCVAISVVRQIFHQWLCCKAVCGCHCGAVECLNSSCLAITEREWFWWNKKKSVFLRRICANREYGLRMGGWYVWSIYI